MKFFNEGELQPGDAGYIDMKANNLWKCICDGIYGKKDLQIYQEKVVKKMHKVIEEENHGGAFKQEDF